MLPDEIRPALQGVIPSCVVSGSLAGEPNVTLISQVWFVDDDHVALSHQFFNKTRRNVRENPYLMAIVACPETGGQWELELQFERAETDGPVFDEMDMKLEAIASMTGMAGIFELKAADIYEVKAVRLRNDRSSG